MKKQVCGFDENAEQNGLSDQELDCVIKKAFGGADPEAVGKIRYILCAARAIAMGFWIGWKKGYAGKWSSEKNKRSGKYAE